jgi:hypothetical protein
MNSFSLSSDQLLELFTPARIRKQAKNIFALNEKGEGQFHIHLEKMNACVDFVIETIRKNYPDGNIPFHSRWGHFRAAGIDRVKLLDSSLASLEKKEKARTKIDLVVPSVLLDAGAGDAWKFLEKSSGKTLTRSEGLGVASLELFLAKALGEKNRNAISEAKSLQKFSESVLKKYFQVSSENPLLGVEGRTLLLRNLGKALENRENFQDGRPGNILDTLEKRCGKRIPAPEILRAVLEGFGSIWPGRLEANGMNLGDTWVHPKLGKTGSYDSLVPIHKLSQWMSYSLIEPIQEAGFEVIDIDKLTGLAEYRNGGLFVDSGVLEPRDKEMFQKEHSLDSIFILEWRSLTVFLLDMVGEQIQKKLQKTSQELPLAKILEGGTWWAGRFLAKEKRDGNPPFQIKSDGTVF